MLLRLQPGFEVRTSRIGDSDLLQQGEYVLALSGRSAETGSSAVSFGIVSEPGMMRLNASSSWLAGVIETDAVISPESAGGPLLDQGGAVVGMLLPRSLNGNDRLSFAVGINEIRLAAEELKAEGKVSRGSLGITVRSVADLRSYEKSTRGLQLDAVSGVLITAGGDSSELKPGDVLLSVNGQTVADVSSLRTILYGVNSGEMAELQILRDGEETVLSTELQ
jgi:serine protease Do